MYFYINFLGNFSNSFAKNPFASKMIFLLSLTMILAIFFYLYRKP